MFFVFLLLSVDDERFSHRNIVTRIISENDELSRYLAVVDWLETVAQNDIEFERAGEVRISSVFCITQKISDVYLIVFYDCLFVLGFL